MAVSNQLKNQHLLWRAGFGPMTEDFNQINQATTSSYLKALFKSSAKSPAYIDVADNFIKGLAMGVDEVGKQQQRQLSAEERKKIREQSKENIKSLNLSWLGQMVNSEQQLREKLSLFWHGHFACRILNIYFQQQLINTIRQNAFSNFGDLLREVSKSPAMLSIQFFPPGQPVTFGGKNNTCPSTFSNNIWTSGRSSCIGINLLMPTNNSTGDFILVAIFFSS